MIHFASRTPKNTNGKDIIIIIIIEDTLCMLSYSVDWFNPCLLFCSSCHLLRKAFISVYLAWFRVKLHCVVLVYLTNWDSVSDQIHEYNDTALQIFVLLKAIWFSTYLLVIVDQSSEKDVEDITAINCQLPEVSPPSAVVQSCSSQQETLKPADVG